MKELHKKVCSKNGAVKTRHENVTLNIGKTPCYVTYLPQTDRANFLSALHGKGLCHVTATLR